MFLILQIALGLVLGLILTLTLLPVIVFLMAWLTLPAIGFVIATAQGVHFDNACTIATFVGIFELVVVTVHYQLKQRGYIRG